MTATIETKKSIAVERRKEEGFAELFVQLARELELPYHVGQLASIMEYDNAESWVQRVLKGLDLLGARARTVELDARGAIMAAKRAEGVLVTFLEEQDAWLMLCSSRRGTAESIRIDAVTGATTAANLKKNDLLNLMADDSSAQGTHRWIIVEPRLTMQIISPQGGPEMHGAKKAIKRVKGLIWLEREGIRAIAIYSILLGILSLLTPIAVQGMVNTIAFSMVLQPLIFLAIVVLTGLAFVGALRALQHYVGEYIQRRIFIRLVTDLSHRLPRVDLDAHEQKHVPELVNRFFDVMTVQKSASSLLLDSLGLVLQMAMGLLVLAFYHPYLLAFAVALTFGLFIVVFLLGRGAISTSLHESDAKYEAAAWLEEIARHPLSFKSKRGEHVAAARAEELSLHWLNARRAHFRVVLRQVIGAVVVQAVASAGLLGLGGYLVFKGQLSLGQLVAAELIVTSVTTSIAKIGKDLESYYDLVAGLHKVGKLVDLPLESSAGELPPENEGGVTLLLDHLMSKRGTGYFKDINLRVEAGERIGITGTDGTAISTLLDVLYGVRIPCNGLIHFDGANISDLSVSALRDHVSLVREADIFEGTIEENLRLGQRDIPSTQLRKALSDVGLLDEFEQLKDGIRTSLGANGSPLSMGQLQRLTLARAILFEPRLILLDHMLDTLHYDQVDTALQALRQYNSTTLIASNRHAVLSQCDRVFELIDGVLIETELQPHGRDGEA